VTWSLALGYFPNEYPALPAATYWLLGAMTSLLFFGSVLLHELGHSVVALRHHIPVRSITLFIFGGVAHIGSEPRSPGAEFRIAIAGPLTSLALAAGFGALWLVDQVGTKHLSPLLAAPSVWLARINLLLALFNLIPGFPLDGGRILRALVWRVTGSFYRATRVATFTGQITAFGFIAWGLYTLFGGNVFNGLWLVFIGWFLQNAAAASYAQANLQQSLHGVTVAQVMARDCLKVSPHVSLAYLVEEKVLTSGQRCFLVAEDDQLRGMVTLRDIAAVPKGTWSRVTVGQAMVPRERLILMRDDTELLEALQKMDDANVAQVPVVEGDRIVGLLSREQVLHYLRIRAELGI